MTFVKICGITNLEDALLSVKFGADALGFNFYEKSPRYISPDSARQIIDELPDSVLAVGVFVNETIERIGEILKVTRIRSVQLHGDENPDYAESLSKRTNVPVIKAFRVSSNFAIDSVSDYEVDAILLDAFSPNEHGGTGKTFDWQIAKTVKTKFPKMYLAGGLSPQNVREAIRNVEPYAVDASSRLETSPGKKDAAKVEQFISAVKEAL